MEAGVSVDVLALPPQTVEDLERGIRGDESVPWVAEDGVLEIVGLSERELLAFERAEMDGYLLYPGDGAGGHCATPGGRGAR